MNTSFHFASAQEFTPVFLDMIKRTYQQKPVSIYIQEDEEVVPQWQIQEVRKRDVVNGNNSDSMLDCDTVINELKKTY